MLALLGATGYTGRLVAAELAARKVPHRLGGRDPDRLARLAERTGAGTVVVDVGDAGRLDAFLDGATGVISTVGPFARLGMPVVEAAVRNRVRYVDCSGEAAFLARVYERFPRAPVAVVPGCGFEVVVGDLAAALAGAGVDGPVEEVVVAYELAGVRPSRGTLRTMVEMARAGGVRPRRRQVRFPEGEREAVEIPSAEPVTVPRHLAGARVATVMVAAPVLAAVAGVAAPALRWAAPLVAPLVERVPEGPGQAARRQGRFRVVAEARGGGGGRASVVCEGGDPYGLTARFLVEAVARATGTGALAPAQALEPAAFLDAVSAAGPRDHGGGPAPPSPPGSPAGPFSWRRF